MKRLLIPFLALLTTSCAQAGPVHLTCTETKSNDHELWTQQFLIDADRGYAKIDSTEVLLVAKPSEFIFAEREEDPDFLFHETVLNRQTLTFKRRWLFWPQGASSFGAEREASGKCHIAPEPKGRKI